MHSKVSFSIPFLSRSWHFNAIQCPPSYWEWKVVYFCIQIYSEIFWKNNKFIYILFWKNQDIFIIFTRNLDTRRDGTKPGWLVTVLSFKLLLKAMDQPGHVIRFLHYQHFCFCNPIFIKNEMGNWKFLELNKIHKSSQYLAIFCIE